jgi:hypothetical protein
MGTHSNGAAPMTKKFTVGIREMHINYVTVEADSVEEALKKALEGEYDDTNDLQYSCTDEDTSLWSVNELTES